jgi:prepilin-type N-terminal cleavage/methylation domain-containing protein
VKCLRLPCGQHGFSLMELAIVLMIVGTLMSGVLVAVSESTANARITNAKAQLREVEEALYGYAQINGHLPCPASDMSNGFADPVADGPCNEPNGFVPVSTLGIYGPINDDGLLLDPWQNPLRYSVAIQVCGTCSGERSFTSSVGLRAVFNDGSIDTTDMLRICEADTCNTAEILSNTVPAVVYSMGANWTDYTSADEIQNSGDGSTMLGSYSIRSSVDDDFVSTTYSEENFDDQLVWISPYVLFNRLVSAGKLP